MASGVHNLLIYYRFCRPGGPLAEVIKGDVIIGSEATPDTAAVTRQPIFHPSLAFSPQCECYLGAGPPRDPLGGGLLVLEVGGDPAEAMQMYRGSDW